ncbi:MAG: hypothetical protein IKP36_08870 [Bacteroidaceae bacterium]|nr:hypothetical protein [Bacteroidaceae bacterium]
MKKTYLKPIVNTESAQPANLLCESAQSNVGLTQGEGSDGEARVLGWNIWGDDEKE